LNTPEVAVARYAASIAYLALITSMVAAVISAGMLVVEIRRLSTRG